MRQDTASLIIHNTGLVDRILRHSAKDLGIRWTALRVLADLTTAGPLTQKQIVEIEQLKQSTISVLLGEMEAEGLIRFERNEDDARSKLIVLTRKGISEHRRCGKVLRSVLESVLEPLTKDELNAVQKVELLLRKQIEHFASS